MNTLVVALYGLAAFVDKTPDAKDVKAGWGAFGVFMALVLAVAFLGWSLIRHLKKAERNAEAGMFGDDEQHKPA